MSDDVRQEFSRAVCDLRKMLQMDADDFADLIGISPEYLEKLETGKVAVSLKTLQKISDCTGAKPILSFVTGDPKPDSASGTGAARRSRRVELPRIDDFEPVDSGEPEEQEDGTGIVLDPESRSMIKVHEYAAIFAQRDRESLRELALDIRKNGLKTPIVITTDYEILDGRARYDACLASGVEPRFVFYHGNDPIGMVDRLNDGLA